MDQDARREGRIETVCQRLRRPAREGRARIETLLHRLDGLSLKTFVTDDARPARAERGLKPVSLETQAQRARIETSEMAETQRGVPDARPARAERGLKRCRAGRRH
jgi:hypothetical protein